MYLKTDEKVLSNLDFGNINSHYELGYLFGRIEPGYMYKTRSLRINLSEFKTNSENRRILRKFDLKLNEYNLPLTADSYDWRIHKLGKDFYSKKFSDLQFSASKIRELAKTEHNFNYLQEFLRDGSLVGYCFTFQSNKILHYCYPFYDLSINTNNLGMRMMLESILSAESKNLKYVYLGGVTRPADKYKLQFKGLEWFDGELWSKDIELLKGKI
jgi:arginyl-tRNA--protein-N-Asp/Glu arginylyltransferase